VPDPSSYRLLDAFRGLFEGTRYQHRDSSRGDWVAHHLYEDLRALDRSRLLSARIDRDESVLCVTNRRQGIKARRGDGSFGELLPRERPIRDPGFLVARGRIATIEIGIEVKILAKAMIKQIDRVKTDLGKQIVHFNRRGGSPILVAIVGINRAEVCTSYEGTVTCPGCGLTFPRAHITDGKKYAHPYQEARQAEELLRDVLPEFYESLVLQYRATNSEPYAFEWVDQANTERNYGAALLRISREYDRRFRDGDRDSKTPT
jgi:hypothetical protein